MPEIQTDILPQSDAAEGPSAPYVGLRPYEREERNIFIGRDLDAQYLTDKIFSARLTLLYSKSGLGKSSVLKTLVVPSLEDQEAQVLYFDAWSGEDPIRSLKSALTDLATRLGIPDAGAGSPSLGELVLLISSFTRRTLVLILDQFEEFLVHHQKIDVLGAELAELVRAQSLDVRLLISLRQEFLAALEPLRQLILNLFQSTYMLENLGDKAVRRAIEEPARKFGKDYSPGLLNRLVEDLRHPMSKQSSVAAAKNGTQIELPMLQLVCNELWNAAQKDSTISIDLYEKLGGVRKILGDYVRRVMPRRLRTSYFTAKLLIPLAPPSGLKLSYSVDDLASITGLTEPRIRAELNRLGKMRILRTRKFQKSERFELLHDSFIKIIGPWRDRILDKVRGWRRRLWTLATLCLVLLIGFGWFKVSGVKQLELYTNTEGALEELKSMPDALQHQFASTRFDNAVSYILWRQEGNERFTDLKELLQNYSDLQPDLYGIRSIGMGSVESPPEGWPVSVHHSFRRQVEWDGFSATWKELAIYFAENWNIPVPKRLRLIEEHIFPKNLFRFKGPDATEVDLMIEPSESGAFIDSSKLVPAAQEFFDQNIEDWKLIREAKFGGPYYVVPKWSLAVWRASGIEATDGSGLPSFRLALKLQQKPEGLVTSHAVELLLERVARYYPHTVSEARAARGSRLRYDFIEWVKSGRALTHLPVLLDALAHHPDKTSMEVIPAVELDLRQAGMASRAHHFSGPWPKPEETKRAGGSDSTKGSSGDPSPDKNQSEEKIHTAYREVEPWLPPVEPAVRVYVGHKLEGIWFTKNDLSTELKESVQTLRDSFFRRFGYTLPGLRFRGSSWDPDLAPGVFRIELLRESAAESQSVTIDTREKGSLDQLVQAIQERVQNNTVQLLKAEHVKSLVDELEPALRTWLYDNYSLTDLKLLARTVLELGPLKLLHVKNNSIDNTPSEGGGGLRHFGWLMGSLVFWSEIKDEWTIQELAEALRSTQRARFLPPTDRPVPDHLATTIADGIAKLGKQHPEQAQLAFKKASTIDSESAIRYFLTAYAAHLSSRIDRQIEKVCQSPTSAWLSRSQRLNLEEKLNESVPTAAMESQRRNAQCLFSGYPSQSGQRRREIGLSLLTQYGSPDQWPPAESLWLATSVLKEFDPIHHNPAMLQHAAAFFESALQRLEQQQANRAYIDLLDVCSKDGAKNWCWDLVVDIAETYPAGYIPLDLALKLSILEPAQHQHQALRMAAIAQKNLDHSGGEEKNSERIRSLVKFARAQALRRLGQLDHQSYLPEAEQLYTELLESPSIGMNAYLNLIDLLVDQERYSEAEHFYRSANKKWPDETMFNSEIFWSNLLRGDTEAAERSAQKLIEHADDNDEALFSAALVQILTGQGKWELTGRKFLATRHPYVEYIAMMLYAKLSGSQKEEARQLLEHRWASIAPDSWAVRCRAGDSLVWREMLIGHYMGVVTSNEIFDTLEDEARYQKSNLRHLPLPRNGMLCEAYFYDAMLAKSRGNIGRMRQQLEKVLGTGKYNYLEFKMAKYLLDSESGNGVKSRIQAGR